MVDISVSSSAAWTCPPQAGGLSDVLLCVHDEQELREKEAEETGRPVLLEQTEEGTTCALTLRCGPHGAVRHLVVVSEARTMEVYAETGEYCGTGRGERVGGLMAESSERGPFYRKQITLESPSTSCDVKLLSLGGRTSVLVCRVLVVLEPQRPVPGGGASIDLQRVQSLMEEMGANLSPGAQNLLDMVQVQQRNQASSMGGFLPLLMGGGAIAALAPGAGTQTSARDQTTSAPPPTSTDEHVNGASPAVNGAPPPSNGQLSGSSVENVGSGEGRAPPSSAQLTQMMSRLLKSPDGGDLLRSTPDFLPALQSVCGQVTQLRLDMAAAAAKEKTAINGTWDLDPAMERRLDEMERRLKEHIDRRLEALEEKLEKVLLAAAPLAGCTSGATATAGTAEQVHTGPRPPPH